MNKTLFYVGETFEVLAYLILFSFGLNTLIFFYTSIMIFWAYIIKEYPHLTESLGLMFQIRAYGFVVFVLSIVLYFGGKLAKQCLNNPTPNNPLDEGKRKDSLN